MKNLLKLKKKKSDENDKLKLKKENENELLFNIQNKIKDYLKELFVKNLDKINNNYLKNIEELNDDIIKINKIYDTNELVTNFTLYYDNIIDNNQSNNNEDKLTNFEKNIINLDNIYKECNTVFKKIEDENIETNIKSIESEFDKDIFENNLTNKIKKTCIGYADSFEIMLAKLRDNNRLKIIELEQIRELNLIHEKQMTYHIEKINKIVVNYTIHIRNGIAEIIEKKKTYNEAIRTYNNKLKIKEKNLKLKKRFFKNKIIGKDNKKKLNHISNASKEKYTTVQLW